MNSVGKLRIGEVHALLRGEYPTIELSKIRYYEEKGLVSPSRSKKGYRLYDDTDVSCLREAIRMAQQEFVPLRVVRQRLIEQGLLADDRAIVSDSRAANDVASNIISMRAPSASAVRAVGEADDQLDSSVLTHPARVANFGGTAAQFDEKDFLAAAQISVDTLRELHSFGFVSPRDVAGRVVYDDCDLIVAKRAGVLVARGVEIRHLHGLKRTVERQMDLLSDLTTPLRATKSRSALDATSETRAVSDELSALRSALLTKSLQRYFGH